MKFAYTYRNTPIELWKLHMYYTYSSIVGVCNLVFTAGMLALIYSRWQDSSATIRSAMVLGVIAFPLIQPLSIYLQARAGAKKLPESIELIMDEEGMAIRSGRKQETIAWRDVTRLAQKPGMLIVFTDAAHGYILTKRIVGPDMKELHAFLVSKIGVEQ